MAITALVAIAEVPAIHVRAGEGVALVYGAVEDNVPVVEALLFLKAAMEVPLVPKTATEDIRLHHLSNGQFCLGPEVALSPPWAW